MKTMQDYAIYCTPEQAKKAIELGAPIDIEREDNFIASQEIGNMYQGMTFNDLVECTDLTIIDNNEPRVACIIPTAEEMLGWLEEQGVSMQIEPINGMHYYWLLSTKELTEEPDRYSWVTQYVTPNYEEIPSRQEATLAAIDAALECLIKIKEEKI